MLDEKGLKKVQYLPGVTIFEEGDGAREAYFIREGRVRITRIVDDEEVELAILEEGDTLGEMSLIRKRPRSAKATAIERTTMVIITEDMMDEKLAETDGLVRAMLHKATERLYKQNDQVIEKP